MKHFRDPILVIFLLLGLGMGLISCTESGCTDLKSYNFSLDADSDSSLCEYPEISIAIRNTFGKEDLPINTPITLDSFYFSISGVWLYASNFSLTYSAHGNLDLADSTLLSGTEGKEIFLGDAFGGYYSQASFLVGISSEKNHPDEATFQSYPAANPLGIKDPPMFWDSTQGYIFLRIEGEVDTTGNNEMDVPLLILVGTDALARQVSVTTRLQVTSSQHLLSLDFDLKEVLSGIDLRKQFFTNSIDSLQLATDIADNLNGAFRVNR